MNNTLPKITPPNHLGHVDGLRALAAMYVVVTHAIEQAGFKRESLSGFGNIAMIFFYGYYAVAVFIVISGFCLMLPVARGDGTLKRGALDFFKRRFWRIVPPYYCAMFLALLLIWLFLNQKTGTQWDQCLPVTGKSIVTHLLLVHDAFGDIRNLCYPFWSISIEWRIYFAFPLVGLGWRYLGPVKTIVLTVVFMHGVSWLWETTVGYSLSASYGVLFAMGMLAASLVWSPDYERYRKLPWNLFVGVATVLMVGATFLQTRHASMVPLFLTNYFVGFWALTILVASSMEENTFIHKCLALKPLVFIGTFSYSLYLIHAPLLQMFWQYVFQPMRFQPLLMLSALLFVAVPLILLAAYLFFLACERPFMQNRSNSKLGIGKRKAL